MPTFPFQRAKPTGWAIYEVLTSSQMTKVDENAAQAADGLVWTDIAAMRNWTPAVTVSQAGLAGCYVGGAIDAWWLFGVNAGAMTNAVCFGGGGVFGAGVSSPVTGISTIESRACAYDQTNNYLVVGVTPSSSSNQKYRRAPMTPSAAFAAGTSSQTNTNGIGVIEHVPSLGMLISGHLGNGVVETSIDGGATWTNRAVPNANPRVAAAVGPAGIVLSSSAGTNKVIRSADGITWTEATLPSSQSWSNVVYVPHLGVYVAINDGMSAMAYSTDGITWATRVFTVPAVMTNISGGSEQKFVAFGRNIYGCVRVTFANAYNVFTYSQDGGVTWKVAGLSPLNSTIGTLRSNGRQLLYTVGTNVMLSVATGF